MPAPSVRRSVPTKIKRYVAKRALPDSTEPRIWRVSRLAFRVPTSIPGALLFLAVLVSGCREPQAPGSTPVSEGPSALISDAAHDPAVEGFYFLPPMVPDPTFDGVFNPDLLPVVEICELTGDPTTAPLAECRTDVDPIRVFHSEIAMVLEDEHYLVPWHAREDDLDAERFYRIQAFGSFRLDDATEPSTIRGSILLGFADVDVVNNRSEVDGVDTEQLVPLVRNQSLPIKFRIEQGALCNARARVAPDGGLDCVDATARVLDDDGGDVVAPSEEAAGRFEAGWIPQAALNAGITEVTVLLARVTPSEGERCLFDAGTGQGQVLEETEPCYQWTTEPELGPEFSADGSFQVFEADVTVAQCRDPGIPEAIVQQFQLHQFDPDRAEAEDPPSGVVALESSGGADELIDCTGFVVFDLGPGPLAELAELGWRRVGRPLTELLVPRRLWAADKGFGGLIGSFSPSNIAWARALQMTLVAGDGQSGAPGTTLPTDPTVELVATHPPGAGTPPVPNVEVTFTVTAGGGTLSAGEDVGSSLIVATDNAGQAQVSWTLGDVTGTQTLEATAPAFGSPVVFTADAIPEAQILFDNGASSGAQGNFANTAGGQELFEDFTLTQNSLITTIRWQQHDHNDATYLSTEILVFAGLPYEDPPVFSSTVVADRTPNQTGTLFDAWEGFDYEISGLAIDLPAGTYWLGLNSNFQGTRSGWDNTTGGPNTIPGFRLVNASNPAPGSVISGDLAFTLLGQVQSLSFVRIDAGSHTCGITTGGTAYCWGANSSGQLGNGSTEASTIPVRVNGEIAFSQIGVGDAQGQYTCGVATDGQGYCWGVNSSGLLGTGNTENSTVPVPVSGGLTFTMIRPGVFSTCGVVTDGSAYCWGGNSAGQLGNGTMNNSTVPVEVAGGLFFATVDDGANYNCGLTTGGEAYCWGFDEGGVFGDGVAFDNIETTPTIAAGGMVLTAFSADGGSGSAGACGITPSGDAYCWGLNSFGQLGDGTTVARANPGQVSGGLTFVAISRGGAHTCGLAPDGTAYCWGNNSFGQLGDGTTTQRLVPTAVSGGLSFTLISAGGAHTCGVSNTGRAYCWGRNSQGQLGNGTMDDSPIPLPVAGQAAN